MGLLLLLLVFRQRHPLVHLTASNCKMLQTYSGLYVHNEKTYTTHYNILKISDIMQDIPSHNFSHTARHGECTNFPVKDMASIPDIHHLHFTLLIRGINTSTIRLMLVVLFVKVFL